MIEEVWVVKWETCVGSEGGETNGIVGVTRTEEQGFELAKLDADSWHREKIVLRPIVDPESRGECSIRIDHETGEEFNEKRDWDIWYDVERWEVKG